MLMNELVKTELFSLLSESSQENTNEEMQSTKVILYSFEIQKYTQGIERKHQALRVLQEIFFTRISAMRRPSPVFS